MKIQDLELTDSDFKMIIDGLDFLPEKGMTGEMMTTLFEGLLSDKSPENMEKLKKEREYRRKKEETTKEQLKEDIKILQGKLLMFKRYLIENNALKQVNDLINPHS